MITSAAGSSCNLFDVFTSACFDRLSLPLGSFGFGLGFDFPTATTSLAEASSGSIVQPDGTIVQAQLEFVFVLLLSPCVCLEAPLPLLPLPFDFIAPRAGTPEQPPLPGTARQVGGFFYLYFCRKKPRLRLSDSTSLFLLAARLNLL